MTTDIAKFNLEKDKNVLGKEWLSTYGNYFSDIENIKSFIRDIKPFLPKRELNILYAASASGLLGEELLKDLSFGKLTIVDISLKHLNENKNPNTEKICLDLLEMDLKKKFDLIIMRSSLDYFPSRELQVKVLKIIKSHLKDGGIFINQPAYIPSILERGILSSIYNAIDKIGKRFFQSTDLESIYNEAGFNWFKKIGEGKVMYLTENDHIERYCLSKDDVKKIQEIIKVSGKYAQITKTGYKLRFDFPIFLAR